jgi:hypothetical protein
MNEDFAVEQIQKFVSKTISWLDIRANGEYVVLEGLAYVWQKNHEWSDIQTANVIAKLLGNYSTYIEEHHNHELIQHPF